MRAAEIAPAHYLGRSKVTLLSPTLSTQTQAEKPKGRGRTVTPPTFQTNASVRHGSLSQFPIHTSWTPNHLPPRKLPSPEPQNLSPSSMALPIAPISQPPSSLMPETLSICHHALGRVPLTPCCWSCLDDGRVHGAGAAPTSYASRAPALLPRSRRPS